jgi:hypothetical protein
LSGPIRQRVGELQPYTFGPIFNPSSGSPSLAGSFTFCNLKLLHMVEPLNESACKTSFTGKIVSNHLDWYNTPLRLNEEERDNLRLILEEFFQSYHLNEVREIL